MNKRKRVFTGEKLRTHAKKEVLPFAVFSEEALSAALALPQKKELTSNIICERLTFEMPFSPLATSKKTIEVLRTSVMNAITTEYLRAVIAICFKDNNLASIKMVHPTKNQLLYPETVGILSLVRETLDISPFKDIAYFVEENVTHKVLGADFAGPLLTHVVDEVCDAAIILNVHHDYLRISHNLVDPTRALLQVMYTFGKK